MNRLFIFCIFLISILTLGCSEEVSAQEPSKNANLSDQTIEEIVKRSYQYVAMYNTNQKMALADLGVTTKGYNKGMRNTTLLDHTVEFIARPNNDVLYQLAMLDLRKDAIVFEIPAIDSRFVSMMATGYDHYVNIPMSTEQEGVRPYI